MAEEPGSPYKYVKFRIPDHEVIAERMRQWAAENRKSNSIPNYLIVASEFYEANKDKK